MLSMKNYNNKSLISYGGEVGGLGGSTEKCKRLGVVIINI